MPPIYSLENIINNIREIQVQKRPHGSNMSLAEILRFYISNSVNTIKLLFQQLNYVPYIIRNDGIVEKNQSAYVRNLATLYDLLRFNLDKNIDLYKLIVKNLKELLPLIQDSITPTGYAERFVGYSALAFYLLCLLHLGQEEKVQFMDMANTIKLFLFQNIENITDTEFELPECLIALCYCDPTIEEKNILYEKLYELLQEYQSKKSKRRGIFQKNWIAKYIYTLSQTIGLPNNFQETWITNLKKEMITFKVDFEHKNLETNEMAVCFEGLSSLLYLTPNDRNTFHQILNLFELLKKRTKNFLLYFTDNTARIDITGHVLNGCYVLLLMEGKKMA